MCSYLWFWMAEMQHQRIPHTHFRLTYFPSISYCPVNTAGCISEYIRFSLKTCSPSKMSRNRGNGLQQGLNVLLGVARITVDLILICRESFPVGTT